METPQKGLKNPDEIFCPSCGEAINQNAVLCMHCGVPVTRQHAAIGAAAADVKPSGETAVFVLGLLSLLLLAPLGIIGWALSAKGSGEVETGKAVKSGLFTAGKILSIIGTSLTALLAALLLGKLAFSILPDHAVQSTTDWSLSPHPPPSPPHQSFTEEETADAREAAASSTRVTPSATTTTHRLSIHCNQDVWLQVYILDSGYGVVEDLSMDGNNGLALKGHEVVRRIPADYGAHVRVGAPELPPFDAVTIGLDGSPVTIRKQVSLNAWECKFHVADVIE